MLLQLIIKFSLLTFSISTEYNSDLSCHYKVELSYENLFTSGPDSHPPPIADDESDDEDDDDVPRVRLVLSTFILCFSPLLFLLYVLNLIWV